MNEALIMICLMAGLAIGAVFGFVLGFAQGYACGERSTVPDDLWWLQERK